jgi:acyl transferase domain-containing protein
VLATRTWRADERCVVVSRAGTQHSGAIAALPDHPEARRTLDEAGRCLGLCKLHDLDSAAAVTTSDNAQLQLLIVAVATARSIIADASSPAFVAGHSTGAISAAVMCGALTFAEAHAVVRERGELMQSLFATGDGMLALSRLPLRQSVSLVKENSEPNDPLRGDHQRTRSDRRCWRGQRPYRSTDVLDDLAQSASHTVQWADAMSLLGELRVTVAIETGPGDILTGLVQRNTPAIRAASVATTRFSDVTYFMRRGASDAATDGR